MPAKPASVITATSANQEKPSTASARIAPCARRRTNATAATTTAITVPSSTGAIVLAEKRLNSSTAGDSAKAALPGLGAFAREPARNGSPAPHHSGRNQSAGTRKAKPTIRRRSRGSLNQSQSPYSARKGHASGRRRAAATPR